jgi:hypothetical protein
MNTNSATNSRPALETLAFESHAFLQTVLIRITHRKRLSHLVAGVITLQEASLAQAGNDPCE